ncbi:alpha/beta hydrolase, partial [Paraburkholderia sp. Ac-20336]|nr:alpha/beta hydrolase [Paraburkholderia sp. Ac-20336]
MIVSVQGQAAYAYTGGKPFDPSLPAAVFIHGAEHDHSVWALQSRYFAHHG